MATQNQKVLSKHGADEIVFSRKVVIAITDGAGAGSFVLPSGGYVWDMQVETPVAIPGSPTTVNLRLGSGENGQQYLGDTDVKAQGVLSPAVLYALRNASGQVYYTVASSGGTAAAQDGAVVLRLRYTIGNAS